MTFIQGVYAQDTLKMSTTTSTENSGLLDLLLPEFTRETGIEVRVLAKGTGAALRDGMDGNVDIVFVHDKPREEQFVADGFGAYRLAVMHNDFVILGPANDPAGIKGITEASAAMKKIYESRSKWISRGDDSGTHAKEQLLWKAAGIPLTTAKRDVDLSGKSRTITQAEPASPAGWYISIGQGMGKTLTFTEEKQAYTLTDRGTFLQYKYGRDQGLDLEILCEGDPALFNPYGIIPVSPVKHPHVRFESAERLAKWLVSPRGQQLIGEYRIQGRQAFFPDAVASKP
ncbi:substrate-binding domain-containing protein [Desulfatiglans anilini]|uniref:substrate-binding domain-containing protein n=1 Tax=Desulfatiglans anilini TaxID=90728 RepID=UPI001FC8F8C1|nr:substrate-binding domain-containing protein [Desulfatiglans anilini]